MQCKIFHLIFCTARGIISPVNIQKKFTAAKDERHIFLAFGFCR